MKKLIIATLIIFVFVLSSSSLALGQVSRNYEIDLGYENGNIILRNIDVIISEGSIESSGEYTAEVRSFNSSIINITTFNIPNIILFDAIDPETGEIIGGYSEILNQTNFTLQIPYYSKAKEIVIFDPNTIEKLRINVGMFAQEIAYDLIDEETEDVRDVEKN